MFIEGIAIKRKSRAPMEVLSDEIAVRVTEENGIEGDYRGRRGSTGFRQISAVSKVQWDIACRELKVTYPWFYRRANLCVSGYEFSPRDAGKVIAVGEDVLLEITGELDPCDRMDEILNGLQAALSPDWRGGVTCRVLRGGCIRRGDQAVFAGLKSA